jgi:hypothetical protein
MNRTRSTARGFALGLESLGDRIVPSVTMDPPVDGVLTIKGDSGANNVEITDDGTTVTVVSESGTEEFTDVTEIKVCLGSGNDDVTYTLTGDVAAERSLAVYLGNGHDTFAGSFAGSVAGEAEELDEETGEPVAVPAGSLDVSVYGMNGHDTLSFDATGADVGAGASLSVSLGGGNGKDTLDAVYAGVLLGDLSIALSGGNGKDTLSAAATFDSTGEDETTGEPVAGGTADIEVSGGNGKDRLTLEVTDDSGESSTLTGLDALVDGGRGKDFADTLGDVEVVGAK